MKIFNNLFNEISKYAIKQTSSYDGTIIENNLIINAGKEIVAKGDGHIWKFMINLGSTGLNREINNNYFWIDKEKYPSYNDEYFAYGKNYPSYIMDINEFNSGGDGDIIQGNRLLDESLNSIMNSDFTLPAGSPAINTGVDISEYMGHV